MAARWLEAHAGERLAEYLGQIAEHYVQAGENDLAAAYLERSGDEALRTNTYQPAREAFTRALDLLPSEAPGRPALLVKLGQACWNLSDYPAATAALEPALEAARRQDDKLQQANALYWLSQVAVKRAEYSQAQDILSGSLTLAEAVGGETLARHLYGLGDVSWRLGKTDEAKKHLEGCLSLARREGLSLLVLYALNRLGTLEDDTQPEGLEAAKQFYDECLVLARVTGNREREATALYNLGMLCWSRGEYPEAKVFHQASLEIDLDLGMPENIAYDLSCLAGIEVELGNLQEAWHLIQEALTLARPLGAPHVLLTIIWGYARLRGVAGDVEHALALYGLIFNHPAFNLSETRIYSQREIARLNADPVTAEAIMARGASLKLEDVIAEIQAYPGPPSPSAVG